MPASSQLSHGHAISQRHEAQPVSAAMARQTAVMHQQAQSLATAVVSMRVTEVVEEETTMYLRDQLISRCAEDG